MERQMTTSQYFRKEKKRTDRPDEIMRDAELMSKFDEVDLLYRAAIREVNTKLEVLGDDFNTKNTYVPIHHIQSRLKTFSSLMAKAERYGIEDPINNMDTVLDEVYDIAGIRVVCNYEEDLYTVSKLLLEQADVDLIRVKDYCKKPKESGYRSLHLVISVPVYLVNRNATVPVEIQFRSIAMDTWASLEHELKYKYEGELSQEIQDQLKECARTLADVDRQMENIRHKVF